MIMLKNQVIFKGLNVTPAGTKVFAACKLLTYFCHIQLHFFNTLMCILALFSKLSVVCLVLSGPKGTSFFNCSRYSRSLARLQTHKYRPSQKQESEMAPTQTDGGGLICTSLKGRKASCSSYTLSFSFIMVEGKD